jgi:hypothetical protein
MELFQRKSNSAHGTPTTEKIFSIYKKFLNKHLTRTSRYSMCTCQFYGKPTFLVSCVKNTKKNILCKVFFSTKLYLFYAQHRKCLFFVKQLREKKECHHLYAKFYIGIFKHFEFLYKTNFKNREHTLLDAKRPVLDLSFTPGFSYGSEFS